MITQISGKNPHLTLKVCDVKKFITNNVEIIFKSNFWSKSNGQNSANIQNKAI